MFSKKSSMKLVFTSVLFLTLSACGWVHTPKKQFQNPVDLNCLKDAPTKLQFLFAGKYTASEHDQSEIKSIWTCVDHALNAFNTYTQGADSKYYTVQELQGFANLYFTSDHPLSDPFADAIFKLKMAVLGGTNTQLTHDEIKNLRVKLNRFGEIILPLAPYIHTLLSPGGIESQAKKDAAKVLDQFIRQLADLLSDSENSLAWKDLGAFILELDHFTSHDAPTALTYVHEQIQLYQYFKLLLVGGDEFAIERGKWKPIFSSISHFYSALFVSSNPTELFDALAIEIESDELEEAKAVQKITGLLKILKEDSHLHSKESITTISDRWAKLLLMNAFLFPDTQGSLSLKPFLDSETLRKLAGRILEDFILVQTKPKDPVLIHRLAKNAGSFISEAASSSMTGTAHGISFKVLRNYALELKPLFQTSNQCDIVISLTQVFQNISAIGIGQDAESLSESDLRVLVEKLADAYLSWMKDDRLITQAVGDTIEIILRAPSPLVLRGQQFSDTISNLQDLLQKMDVKVTAPWDEITRIIRCIFRVKGLLFGAAEDTFSTYELKRLAFYYEPFRTTGNMDESLAQLAVLLENKPFQKAKLENLIPAIDSFLPEDQRLEKLGFTLERIGLFKSLLVGGDTQALSAAEYSKLVRFGSRLTYNMRTTLPTLPEHFKPGLNSATLGIAQVGLQTVVDAREGQIKIADVKALLLNYLKSWGYSIHSETIDHLLMGITYRILQGNLSDRPEHLPDGFDASLLSKFLEMAKNMKYSFLDYENAFTGTDPTRDRISKDLLLKKLVRPETKDIVNQLIPLLDPNTGFPLVDSTEGGIKGYGLDDLYLKSMMYHVLQLVFPSYEIEPDPDRGSVARLSYNDVLDLLADVNSSVYELHFAFNDDPPEVTAKGRMQTINLFTRSGNGDEYIDIYETIEFLTTTIGTKRLLNSVRKELVHECYPDVHDYEQVSRFSSACVKKHFFSDRFFQNTYIPVVPQMVRYFLGLTAEAKDSFRTAILRATRPTWQDETEFELADIETLVNVPYYAENVFERLDTNHDDMVVFSEAMKGFPLFCTEIQKAAGKKGGSCVPGENPGQLEAIYGYLLFYGTPPQSPSRGDSVWRVIVKAKNFYAWLRYWNHLDRDPAVRDKNPPFLKRSDLMGIISNLSSNSAPAGAPAVTRSGGSLPSMPPVDGLPE